MPQPPIGQPVITATFRGSQGYMQAEMERTNAELFPAGYRIEGQQLLPGRRGCLGTAFGVLFLGIPFLLWRPADRLMVTYRLDGPAGFGPTGRDPWKPPS